MNWKSQRFFKSTTSGCPRCEPKHKENVHVLVFDCCLVLVLGVGFLGVQGQGPGVNPILFPLHYTNSMCEVVNSFSISVFNRVQRIPPSSFASRFRRTHFLVCETEINDGCGSKPNDDWDGRLGWGWDGIGLFRTPNTEGPPKCTEISIEISPLTRSFNRRTPNDVDG